MILNESLTDVPRHLRTGVHLLSRNSFDELHASPGGGRIGQITIAPQAWSPAEQLTVETPYVFPVINVIGGPPGPERNGGLWRPVKWWMFLHEQIPGFLCQVLHVLDFHIRDAGWGGWKAQPFSRWIANWQQQPREKYPGIHTRHDQGYPFRRFMEHWDYWRQEPGGGTKPPIVFLDSGGFTLMNAASFRRAHDWYGLNTTPADILDLQLKMGGDLIASLDFPLPPGLTPAEMHERQQRSIDNGLELLRLLAARDVETHALPYIAVHGTTRESARSYVETFFERWLREPAVVRERKFGLAIGSMVPRADQPRTVVEVAWGVREAVQAALPHLGGTKPPVHMFGISSHLIGLLSYIGVDTFDSQTYAQVAQRAEYMDEHLRPLRISDVTDAMVEQCANDGCFICRGIAGMGILQRMKEILTRKEVGHVNTQGVQGYYYHLRDGERCTRSDLYGLLAMHNWHRVSQEVARVKAAVEEDRLARYLAEVVRDHNGRRGHKLRDALAWMGEAEREAGDAPRLQEAQQTVLGTVHMPRLRPADRERVAVARSKRTPADFSVPADYRPPEGKRVLLIMACTQGKPYGTSQHQRQILQEIRAAYPSAYEHVHKVTLSGLYGPVPEELEETQAVVDYDFKLEDGEGAQAALIGQRLNNFLRGVSSKYTTVLAYVYFPAYRTVVEQVFREVGVGQVVPAKVHRSAKPKAYRQEAIRALAAGLKVHPVRQLHLDLGR